MGNCINSYLYYDLIKTTNEIPLFSFEGQELKAKIVDVYDGDTCSIVIRLNNKLTKFKLRCYGYDSPEMKPPLNSKNREIQINKAIESRNYFISRTTNCPINLNEHYTKTQLKDLLLENTKIVNIKSYGWDKYGRMLGEIYVNNVNINKEMITKNYGYPYDGGTKKTFS